jgi:Leucine-rich repeat (LRR) protein
MLSTVQFLDLSENAVSHIDGLENMKQLSVLKLKYNRISSFQGLRLLSYNT